MPTQQTLDFFLSSTGGEKNVASAPASIRKIKSLPSTSKTASVPRSIPSTRVTHRSDAGSDSDSDIRGVTFTPSSKTQKPGPSKITQEVAEDSLSDLDEMPSLKRLSRRKKAPSTPTSSRSASPLSQNESEGDGTITAHTTKHHVTKRVVDSDDEAKDSPPKRRRVVRGKAKPVEVESDKEDDEDLLDEVDTKQIIENRFRAPKQSAYKRNLEKLKRRKRGSPMKSFIVQDDEGDEDEDEDGGFAPFVHARPDDDINDDNLEDNDLEDTFIVEDGDEEVEVELPAEFSRNSHQDLSVHFKVICQLFVHLAITPPRQRRAFMKARMKDSYFALPLTTMRRKISSLKDSLVTSNAWKPNFTAALKKYPDFTIIDLDSTVPYCDACKLGGRMSTLLGRTSGQPYDKDCYLPEEDDDEEDEEDDEENPNEFNLGRFCARRARAFHSFTHWEYILFESLSSEVDAVRNPGETLTGQAFVRVSWGGGAELPTDTNNPDQIMDWLDARGILQAEWRNIKSLMDDAHHLDARRSKEED